jgi:hypothetical protein
MHHLESVTKIGDRQYREIDPSFVISHRVPLDSAPEMYKTFRDKQEDCTKVVLDPWAGREAA